MTDACGECGLLWRLCAECSVWQHCVIDQGFPLIFHGVMGKDEREANSPSFFNVSEIEVLIGYLKKLLQSHGKKGLPKLSASDIGIIAPYRKQVRILIANFSIYVDRFLIH